MEVSFAKSNVHKRMETYTYDHLPLHLKTVHTALFSSVSNAAEIRARIVQAASLTGDEGERARAAVDFAFVDARQVTSRLHLQTAVHQAALAAGNGTLTTRTVHSEVLWALCPTHNITDALRRYGVSDTSTSLFVIRVGPASTEDISESSVLSQMEAVVNGELKPLDALVEITDWAAIRKNHKLNSEPHVSALAKWPEKQNALINELAISSVAMKSVMA